MLKTGIADTQIEVEKLHGFYMGVVEDNIDPLKAGRVRVRIHGIHSEQTIKDELDGIPVDELPWAEPVLPIYEGSVSGFGIWSVPRQGSLVVLFFLNGNVFQPRYFGSLPGIPESQEHYSSNESLNRSVGFKDPDGKYPLSKRLGEPDVERLARGVKADTIVETKDNNRDTGVSIAGGGTWDEPQSPFAAEYPENFVIHTHNGLVIELDNTEGNRRINIYHPSNSFIEIDESGNMVIKNAAEKYEITLSGRNVHVVSQENKTIDSDKNLKVGGNHNEEIGGNKTEEINGNKEETVNGNLNITVSGNVNLQASGIVTIQGSIVNIN
jgi:hypothetical protein